MAFVFRACRMVLLAMLFFLPAAVTQAAPDIMPLDQIKAGMHGIAKTVVAGSSIEEFDVEILGVMKKQGPSGDLILVRTSGDVINRTGGIAEGMSGSPVYIDGKLVGAIAYGWAFADSKVGMVTPIEDMLKLWALPDGTVQSWDTSESVGQPAGVQSLATPIMASGFSPQALDMLKNKLQAFNLVPVDVGSAPDGTDFGNLEPGSALGVELVHGDVSLAAIGTVTYAEDNKILAFGHPFLKKGLSKYFLTNAYIFTTVKSLQSSFKVGTTGSVVGVVNQDRGAGIAGVMNSQPNSVPMYVTVTDRDLGQSRLFHAELVPDEELAPALGTVTAFNSIEKVLDRTGAGTATVSFEITAKNIPGQVLKRENMFYSPENIGVLAVTELNEALSILSSNKFQQVDITGITMNVSVEAQQRTASVMSAKANVTEVKPGDQVEITVNLLPYRGQAFERKLYFTIPKDQPAGPLTLEVRGGGTIPLIQLLAKQQNVGNELLQLAEKLKTQSFAETIAQLTSREHNNDIVVEILDVSMNGLIKEETPQTAVPAKLEVGKPNPEAKVSKKGQTELSSPSRLEIPKSIASTEYIVDNDAQVVVNVKGDTTAKRKKAVAPVKGSLDRSVWH
ncbi:MAG: peptidase SpoIVB [Firmicutes bacterium]|nr:peptidase SpoIVB [Bacillota bacterium]